MKPTRLTLKQWNRLYQRLAQDYPPSHLIIRSTMRRELGFTSRRHAGWHVPRSNEVVPAAGGYYRDCVYLDWYDEVKRTFFILKYNEYLEP